MQRGIRRHGALLDWTSCPKTFLEPEILSACNDRAPRVMYYLWKVPDQYCTPLLRSTRPDLPRIVIDPEVDATRFLRSKIVQLRSIAIQRKIDGDMVRLQLILADHV